jgi:hypothetical protein
VNVLVPVRLIIQEWTGLHGINTCTARADHYGGNGEYNMFGQTLRFHCSAHAFTTLNVNATVAGSKPVIPSSA